MTEVQRSPHNCGQCKMGFATEALYLAHQCAATGFKPTEPQSMGEDFEAIQDAALVRGEARRGEVMHPAEAMAKATDESKP